MPSTSETRTRRNVKDNVFRDLFSDTRYTFELYRVLHPEDAEATVDDVRTVTLDDVIVTGMVNDLGFTVRNRLLILVEAQSTWSANIALRALFYLAETLKRYVRENELDLYQESPIAVPVPEVYVLYTGRQNVPSGISLSELSFEGAGSVDVRVKVLCGGEDDIVGQYVGFTQVCNEQITLLGRTEEAAREILRICKERGYLAEYLAGREKEVVDIMFELYDAEEVQRIHLESELRKARATGTEEGRREGLEKGQEEGRKKGRKETLLESAKSLMANLGYDATQALEVLGVTGDEASTLLGILEDVPA